MRCCHLQALVLSAFVIPLVSIASPRSERPNVLFVAVDDLNDWVGFMNGCPGKVHTPALDGLAARGTAFVNAHTASPVCCPSRAAVMSGRLPSSTGIYNNQHWWKPNRPNLVTIPGYFKRHGYYVAGAGKLFHHTAGNNPPGEWHEYRRLVFNDDAFSRRGGRYDALYPFTKPQPRPKPFPFSGVTLYSPEVDWGVLKKPEGDFDDAQTVSYGVEFFKRRHDKPFFLGIGIFRPHMPWYVPAKYRDRYPLDKVKLPDAPADDLNDVPAEGRKLALRKAGDLAKTHEAGQWKTAVQHYLASITFADAQIGRLLAALDQSAYAKNTIIVLWSDHGWHLGEKGHWHKRTLWEESTRVPLIVLAPNRGKAGQRVTQPASLVDVFPTLIDLCALPSLQGLDGLSLTAQLDDPNAHRRPAVSVDEFRHVAVRSEHHRYIRYKDGSEEFYDHRTDPNEWRNRADDRSLAQTKEKLAQWLPKSFAKGAQSKKAFTFDPQSYSWTEKITGRKIEGGECRIVPSTLK